MFKKLAFAAVLALSAMHASAEIITLQPGAEGKDADIADTYVADYNFGTSEFMVVNWAGSEDKFGLIEFDLTPYAGRTVLAASLRLYAVYNTWGGQQYAVSQNLSAWDEQTITYNSKPAAGAAIDTLLTVNDQHWYSFNVTSAISGWLAGQANYGFRISETNGFLYFASSDHGDAALRPVLEIVVADVPEPASAALLAMGLLGLGLARRRKR